MSGESKSSSQQFSILGIPAILISILALFGIQLNNSNNSAAKSQSPLKAEIVQPDQSAKAPLQYVQAMTPPNDSEILEILDPLVRFYSLDLYNELKNKFQKNFQKKNEKTEDDSLILNIQANFKAMNVADIIFKTISEKRMIKDKSKSDLKSLEVIKKEDVHKELLKLLGDSQFKVKPIIGIVPDPIYSGMAYRYDNVMLGIIKGITDEGYLMDSFSTHWKLPDLKNEDKSDFSNLEDQSKYYSEKWVRKPGMILFRKKPVESENSSQSDIARELVALLLVPETPIEGIDVAVLAKAIHVADKFDEKNCNTQIKIIGPSFSGSYSSVVRTLNNWNTLSTKVTHKSISWNNGSASLLSDNNQINNFLLINNFLPIGKVNEGCLIKYIKEELAPTFWNKRIAILSEELTGFGAIPINNDKNIYEYKYPLNIAEIRKRVEVYTKDENQNGIRLQNAEQLRFDIDREGEQSELLPTGDPSSTALSEELRLLKVVSEINRLKIRYIIIKGTDVRDKIYLAGFLKKHCPNAQLLTSNCDISLTHSDKFADLNGLIVSSAYPIWFENEIRSEGKRKPVLPNEASYAYYIATRMQFSGETYCMLDNKIWIMTVSLRGFLPLYYYCTDIKTVLNGKNLSLWESFVWRHSYINSGVSLLLPLIILFFLIALYLLTINSFRNMCNHVGIDKLPFDENCKSLYQNSKQMNSYLKKNFLCRFISNLFAFDKVPDKLQTLNLFLYVITLIFLCLLNKQLHWLIFLEYSNIFYNYSGFFISIITLLILVFIQNKRVKKSRIKINGFFIIISIMLQIYVLFVFFTLINLNAIGLDFVVFPINFDIMSSFLKLSVMIMFLIPILKTIELIQVFKYCKEISTEIESLPMGNIFEQIPRLLTVRNHIQITTFNDRSDIELKSRIAMMMNSLREEYKTRGIYVFEIHEINLPLKSDTEAKKLIVNARNILNYFLNKHWPLRDSITAFADGDETNKIEGNKSVRHIREAELILAAMLVRYLNRVYDLVWYLVATLMIHVICTFFFLNSYPFQPAGDLYKWFAFMAGVAMITCIWVIIGISRDGVMARVKRSPEGIWVLNGELVGKLVGFAAPILTLLATLSLGFSDLFRVLFRPFF